MARVTVNLHGEVAEKIGTDRVFLKGNTVKEIFEQLKNLYPELINDIKFGRIVCIINGRNIETLNRAGKVQNLRILTLWASLLRVAL